MIKIDISIDVRIGAPIHAITDGDKPVYSDVELSINRVVRGTVRISQSNTDQSPKYTAAIVSTHSSVPDKFRSVIVYGESYEELETKMEERMSDLLKEIFRLL